MIAHLRGVITRLDPGEVTVDIGGVGYRVFVPLDVWERVAEGNPQRLWTFTYVREDRFDLYGFLDQGTKLLFEELLNVSGIGPRTALELCGVPRSLLSLAVAKEDPAPLTSIRGIGRKTAEKILLELKSLVERHPTILMGEGEEAAHDVMDPDAIAALEALGYDAPTITRALAALPSSLASTEERVKAALRSL
jgi:Holliday junction DNA helicase RuvA